MCEVERLARKLCAEQSSIKPDHQVYDKGWRPYWTLWTLDAEAQIKEQAS